MPDDPTTAAGAYAAAAARDAHNARVVAEWEATRPPTYLTVLPGTTQL